MPLTVVQTGVGGTGQTHALIPSGTAMLFQQTAAPTGWTKITSNDNAALRIVSGAASTGGSVNFTTAFASQAVNGTVGTSGSTTATNNSYTPAGSVSTSTSTGITYLNDPYYMPYHQHTVEMPPGHSLCTQFGGGTTFCTFSFAPDSVNNYTGYGGYSTAMPVGGNGYHNHSASSSSSFSGTPATITQAAHTHTGGTFTGTAINLAVKYVDAIIATKD